MVKFNGFQINLVEYTKEYNVPWELPLKDQGIYKY